MYNPPPSRTSKSGVSHLAEHLPQLMLSLSPLQPRVWNTRTPPTHSTPRSIRSTISHHLCCAHKSWVRSSTFNTPPPGSRRHLSPHTRTRRKSSCLENIHRHRQGLYAETPESSAGSVLLHTQEKMHGIRRSNMPHSAYSPPQQIRDTHKPRHRVSYDVINIDKFSN